MLSTEQIQKFKDEGVLVVEDVFSSEEVAEIRKNFHHHLFENYGVDHERVLASDPEMLDLLGGARMKSPVSNTFYPRWKLLECNLNIRVWSIFSQIFASTFANKAEGFSHPYPRFDPKKGYILIDRVCYRLPDYVRKEGGLSPHLDRNPIDPYLLSTRNGQTKWRPIQGLISLTDHYTGDSGGLRCVKGFHKEIDDYFKNLYPDSEEGLKDGGEFYRLHPNKHQSLHDRCQPITAPAGSLVLWDNRLVHSTDQRCQTGDTREVLYTHFLPAGVPCNDRYAKLQLQELRANRIPPIFKNRNTDNGDIGDRDWEEDELTPLQRQLLGIYL